MTTTKFTKNQQEALINWIEQNPNNLPQALNHLIQSFNDDSLENRLDKIELFEWSGVQYTMLDAYKAFLRYYKNVRIIKNPFENSEFVKKLCDYLDDGFGLSNDDYDNIPYYLENGFENFINDVDLGMSEEELDEIFTFEKIK